ncbi:hypothetical protein D9758_015817 [Tetrapyrgos nigripes]|uniref:Reverse transcriptase domain-containing protein n=1 Tax=Tetrapyrgos nigripes TaxID=182062 RepID=A0A8H5CH75_9AGAR|nr:hypothetical protein D9758_015817 [Tetrapyrgos nigripes]
MIRYSLILAAVAYLTQIAPLMTTLRNTANPLGLGVAKDSSALIFKMPIHSDLDVHRKFVYIRLGGSATIAVSPSNCALDIHSSSMYLINSLTYWAPQRADTRWSCTNGDLLSTIVQWITSCPAPVTLNKIKSGSSCQHYHKAAQLARSACDLPLPLLGEADDFSSTPPPPRFHPLPDSPTQQKVSTNLEPCSPSSRHPTGTASKDASFRWINICGHSLRCRLQTAMRDRIVEASVSPAAFWKLYKKLHYPSLPPPLVTLHFSTVSNLVSTLLIPSLPISMLHVLKSTMNELVIAKFPHLPFFLLSTPRSQIDDALYSLILDLDNLDLCQLYCKCFRSGKVPTAWLITLLSALPKRNKDLSDPNNYRAIALETAEDGNLIPPSQNGFRAGHCTHSNALILRSLIECARARGKTLFIAFVEISNAFPSTNHNALWNCLEDLGLTGIYYDWLCNLYRDMHYRLIQDDNVSEDFEAGSGILMGDPASPLLWNLYLSTFQLSSHPDDMTIDGTTISHLEHANNMVIISCSAAGLQHHLNQLEEWCFHNFLALSPSKSEVMIFGNLHMTLGWLRQIDPIAYICGLPITPLKLTDNFKHVGITFYSTEHDIFARLYDEKAKAATISSHSILGTEHLVGCDRIPPSSTKSLYTALVDCHLIFGCEIALDTTNTGIQKLEKVQNSFLHHILGLSRSSPLPPLFTETGIRPLPAHCAILALSFLKYVIQLPATKLPRIALNALLDLRSRNIPCWLSDLDFVLWALPHPPHTDGVFLPPNQYLSPAQIDIIINEVKRSSSSFLLHQIDTFSCLSLLCNWSEPTHPAANARCSSLVILLRHYLLQVHHHRHHHTLTRLLCGDVSPWVFYCAPGRTLKIDDDPATKLCHFCQRTYETPEHIIIQCLYIPQIVALRSSFMVDLGMDPLAHRSNQHTFQLLQCWIFNWDLIPKAVKLIHNIFIIWKDRCDIPWLDETWEDERKSYFTLHDVPLLCPDVAPIALLLALVNQ